jgi:hypothetical protein
MITRSRASYISALDRVALLSLKSPQREAELYQEWIANDRRHRAIIAKMREVAATPTALLLKENPRPEP